MEMSTLGTGSCGRRAAGAWMKVAWLERACLLRIAVRVRQHGEDSSRVVPGVGLFGVRHPDQFPQRERAGNYADDTGELPDESPDVDTGFSAAAILRSSSSLSSRWFAVSIAIPSSRLSFTSALRNTVRRALGKKSTSSSSSAWSHGRARRRRVTYQTPHR